ncbi:hypothetical protein F0562_019347 [Nyssa sinensis]|uniref:Cyclic nucleotide-binding domain-containing protein n=1 Tax=Nyssa sinensis TaxID=561372 RepID=A0A5J4ZF69_9ASTE|nr:hypothetical protein F0562_019347 [Nyssa sinensis]
MGGIRRGFEKGSEGIKSLKNSSSDQPAKAFSCWKRILDPHGSFLQKWNKIFVISCVIAVSLDPLFFYIPVIDGQKKCLRVDKKLEITACVLRSFIDIFYLLHILFQFHTGFIAPPSRVLGRGELIEDRYAIAKRYLSSYFIFDVLSVLPLPQVVVLVLIPNAKETAWAGAAFNLILYMLASHVVGAFWYLFAIEGKDSSFGQNLKTSTFVWEILFAVFISILGLVLFSLLIGNMQKYLQSITVRVEEMRVKKQDAEQWMSHRMLPENLRQRIRRCLMFKIMDPQLLDAICDYLKPVLYTENSYVVREGDPVDEMLFVMRGSLITMTTNGGRSTILHTDYLKAGDFCGEELLTWALDPNNSSILPSSTRTVKAVTDVEAFALVSADLKFVASQYRRLQSKQVQHTFRYHSPHWRTWAAVVIRAAWIRHCRRKLKKSLREEEDRLQDALAKEGGNSLSLGATIYASMFSTALRRNHAGNPELPHRLPPLLVQKPEEPDFTAKDR